MSRLDELINELCPDGVEFVPLEKCCNILDKQRKPITKSKRTAGEFPYYGANGIQDYVSSYIFDGTFVLVGEDGSVVTPNGNPVVTWAQGKIWVNNHAHVIEEVEGVLLRYLYHYIQTIDVRPFIHGNIPKLTGGDFRALPVPLPPLPVQSEIVRILDKFTEAKTELTSLLSAELTARRKQYEYYRDKLLTPREGVTIYKLHDVAKVCRGVRVVKSQLSESGKYAVYQNCMAPMGYYTESNCPENTTFMIAARAAAGCAGYSYSKFWAADDCFYFECSGNLISRYLYHVLLNQKEYIQSKVRLGTIPRLSRSTIERIEIPLPPLPVQARIVSILDRFDSLCNDITAGLPAEIAAREKQYSFYRDRLLSFKRRAK